MSKVTHEQVSFNSGEISDHAKGRTDLDRYRAAVSKLENFIPLLEGPIEKRPGTQFISNSEQDKKSLLFPFEYSIDQSYVMEFTEKVVRVYANRALVFGNGEDLVNYRQFNVALVTDTNPVLVNIDSSDPALDFDTPPPSVETNDTVFIDGTAQLELNGRYFQVRRFGPSSPWAIQLVGEDGTGRYTGVSGGTVDRVIEIETPYLEADLHKIQTVQIADEVFVTCPGYRVAKVVRYATSAAGEEWIYMPLHFAREIPLHEHQFIDSGGIDLVGSNVRVTITAHGYLTGDIVFIEFSEMVELNGRYFVITFADANTFILNGEDGTGRVQTANKERFRGKIWLTIAREGTRNAPPFHNLQTSAATMYTVVNMPGSPDQIVCSDEVFGPEHNGMCVEIYEVAGGGDTSRGWGIISTHLTEYVDTVDIIVGVVFPTGVTGAGNATTLWAFEAVGHNTAAFYENRLWLAGTAQAPQVVWGSVTADYENFINYFRLVSGGSSSVIETSGQRFEINDQQINEIIWMTGSDPLVIGTGKGEFTIRGVDPAKIISATNIPNVKRASLFGSSKISPVIADTVILFVQRSGKKIREFRYRFDEDTYVAENITRLARHIAQDGVVQMAFQDEPTRLLWIVTEDGNLAAFVYERAEEVAGWSRQTLGGNNVEVESVAVIPNSTDDENEVWLSVKRTVNGVVRRHIEVITSTWEVVNDNLKPWFLDSAARYDGAPITTMRGLNHLAGDTVNVVADGRVHPPKLVAADGSIALEFEASVVTAGPGYVSKMTTVDIERAAASQGDRTTQGKMKTMVSTVLQLLQTGAGLFFGSDPDFLEEFNTEAFDEIYDRAGTLFDGQTEELTIDGTSDREAALVIEHRLALPMTLVSSQVELQIEGGER